MRIAAGAAAVLGIAAAGAPLASSTAAAATPLHGNGSIAYDCGGQICTINPDGSGQATLTSFASPAQALRPRWSPDGTKLTFYVESCASACTDFVYVMDATGANQLRLTDSGFDTTPSFSADGASVLYAHHDTTGGTYGVQERPVGGGSATQVTQPGSSELADPAESPDGTKVMYLAGPAVGFGNVTVFDKTALTTTPLTTTGEDGDPAWAPDGSVIYFHHLPSGGGSYSIESITPAGTGLKPILTNGTFEVAPSPDGTKLAYYALGPTPPIQIANSDGTGVAVGVPNTVHDNFDPAWRPAFAAALSTIATPGPVAVGTPITDSATLSGLPSGTAGTITFSLFDNPACAGLPLSTSTANVTGSSPYSATPYAATAAGTYYWTASYSGDPASDTAAAAEGCGGAGESTVVTGSAGPITDGSFESPVAHNLATFDTYTPGASPASFGWNVTGNSIDLVRGYWQAADGSQSVDLDGNGPGGVSQTIATSAGQAYLLTFAYSANPDRLTGSGCTNTLNGASMSVTWGGVQVGTFSYSTPNSRPSNMGWRSATLAVTATGAQTSLAFSSLDPPSDCGIALDAVSLTPTESNTTWTQAQTIPLSDDGAGHDAGSATGSLDSTGQAGWYKFAVAPGESLNVDLTGLPANYDLTLFSDIGQAFDTLNSTSDLQQLSAEFAPSAWSPSAWSPSAFSPSATSPSAWSPSAWSPSAWSPSAWSPSAWSPSAWSPSAWSPSAWSTFDDSNGAYESAQTISAIAVSSADGTADEHIVANTWNNTGVFYIRVAGRNGTYDPGAPFTVSASEDVNSCSSISTHAGDTLLTPAVVPTAKTLILEDSKRMPQGAALTEMQLKLQAFAGQVGGTIVDIGSQSPRADALVAQAQSNPGCVYAENLAAGSIRDIVSLYRNVPASPLKYIVVVGNDHDIPFFRYPDASGLGTETNYVPPVGDNTPSQASLRLNYVLSQDAYGASTILHQNGLDIPVPDLPVGRLVETPAEISGMLDAFTAAYNGTTHIASVTPSSSLVTGYDFLASSANQVQGDFSGKFAANAESLIAAQGTPTAQAWTADDLRGKLLSKPHGLIYLAGHFSANNTLAADFATTMNSTEIAASSTSFQNSIVFSAGCHSGYNITNEDGIVGVTQPLDWVEALAQKQATVIAGTGYQYGDTDFVAYSAKLYAAFAHNLVAGSVGVGNALVDAKQQYLEDTTQLSGIDVKSLLESTLYGLPMLDVTMPGVTPLAASVQASAPTTVTTIPAPAGTPGGGLGLSSADEHFPTTPPLSTEQHQTLTGAPVQATYLKGPDGVVTDPGEPVLPLLSTDVTVSGQVLRGVGFRGASFNDESGVIPLTGDPGTDQDGTHTPFSSPTFFPQKPWSVNYFSGLSNRSTAVRLLLTPGQYKTDGPNTDLQRQFTSMDLRLFYSGNISFRALAAPPSISRVDASSDSSGVAFGVQVVGDPSAGIQGAWVTWRPLSGNGSNQWTSLDLTQGKDDPTSWTGSLPAGTGPIEFMVQAVNGVGLVTLDDNDGAFYQPNQIPTALQTSSQSLSATSLTLGSTTSAAYNSTPSLNATLAPKSGGGSIPNGETVTFTVGQATATATTSGGSASVNLPLAPGDLPGSGYHVSASFAGDSTFAGSSASKTFTITTLPTTLTLSGGGTVPDGAATGIGATLKTTAGGTALSQRTVEFVLKQGATSIIQTRITDPSGLAALGAVPQGLSGTYTVSAFFGPGGPTPPTLPGDAVYAPSTAAGSSLTVNPVVASIAAVPPTTTNASSVSWTVTFSGSVSAPAASNFAVVVKPGSTLTGAAIGSVVTAGVNKLTVTASVTGGNGVLGLSTTGITDSVGGPVANLVNQAPITIEKSPPTITFVLSKGTYGTGAYDVLDTIKITCTANPGSSFVTIASPNPCASPVVNNVPASTYGPGTTVVPAVPLVATDTAGNKNTPGATTSFMVKATPSTLCTLTTQFIQGSAKYAALSAAQKKLVSALATGLCNTLSAIVPKLSPAAKTLLLNAYRSGVQSLVTQGWLTSAQAATLNAYVATI